MSEKLRAALQALDRELDRLQTTARDHLARDDSATDRPVDADAVMAMANPAVRQQLETLRGRLDGSIARIEGLLKEEAGGAD